MVFFSGLSSNAGSERGFALDEGTPQAVAEPNFRIVARGLTDAEGGMPVSIRLLAEGGTRCVNRI